ncbi:isochorismate synthase [Lysinibacillus sp. FSL H8-0500]|uniref:isochorismate synthase n=1 Tax=Lysinibacillus sp. FSL H8-0500 TaxID=2921393 RepID=UPI00310121A8
MMKTKLSEILQNFQKQDTLFKTPEQLLLCKGSCKRFRIEYNDPSKFKDEMIKLQQQYKTQMMIAAIPFDGRTKATIIVPEKLERYDKCRLIMDLQVTTHPLMIEQSQTIPDKEQFSEMVRKAINFINDQHFNKVVLARTLNFHLKDNPPISSWLTNLLYKNNQGYIFSMGTDDCQTLIGASPELLVKKDGAMVTINPLAGSRKQTFNKIKDAYLEKELLNSDKDLYEHKIVVDYMCEKLHPYLSDIEFNQRPEILYTDTMIHLSTVIKGKLTNNTMDALDLAQLLHPTPAICGEPQKQSLHFIQEIEPFNRGFYTGLVGYMDSNGDGEWVIAIRCAAIEETEVTLFAGAGIVNNSVPNSEYNEISAKLTTMLDAMELKE